MVRGSYELTLGVPLGAFMETMGRTMFILKFSPYSVKSEDD
jgi:hypothetical protein